MTPSSPDAKTSRDGSSLAWRIVRAALVVGVAHIFVKFFGLIQAKALAHYFGATTITDIYLFVFDGILFTIFLIGEKLIGPAFLPVFKECLDGQDEDAAWDVASAVLHLLLLLLFLTITLLMVFPEGPITFFAWMTGREVPPGRIELSSQLLRGMAPALLGLSVGSLTYIILNGYKRFFWAAFGDASLKIAIIASIVLGGAVAIANIERTLPQDQDAGGWRRFGPTVGAKDEKSLQEKLRLSAGDAKLLTKNGWLETVGREYRHPEEISVAELNELAGAIAGRTARGVAANWLIAGVLIAGFAKLLTHLIALGGLMRRIRWRAVFHSPGFRTALLLAAPLVIGILVARTRDIVNNYGVLIPLQEQGLATANNFGRKIYGALGWLIPYALSIAMFPYFCELIDRKDEKAVGKFLDQSFSLMLFFFVPLALVISVLSLPIARLLFEGGRFSLENAKMAATANAIYTLVLPAYALEYLYMQAFFSKRKMVSVTVIGIIFSIFSISVSLVAVRVFKVEGMEAILWVASGYVISRCLKTTTLILYLRRFLPHMQEGRVLLGAVKILVLGLMCAAAAYGGQELSQRLLHARDVKQTTETIQAKGRPLTVYVHQMANPDGARAVAKAFARGASPGAIPYPGEVWRRTDAKGQTDGTIAIVRGSFYIELRSGDESLTGGTDVKRKKAGMRAMLLVVGPELLIAGTAALAAFLFGCWILRLAELGLMIEFGKGLLRQRRERRGGSEPDAAVSDAATETKSDDPEPSP